MAKKTTKKTATKTDAKKTVKTAKKTAKTAKVAKPSSNGSLRKPQVRILATLAKSKKELTRTQIAEKAEVDHAMLNSYIGAHDDTKRKANDKKNFPSLRTLALIKLGQLEIDGRDTTVYSISAKGRKALATSTK